MQAIPRSRYLLFFSVALAGCAVDLASKSWVFDRLGMPAPGGPRMRIMGDMLSLETSLNEGALFGMGQGKGFVFVGLSMVAAIGIVVWLFVARAAHDLWLTFALACVSGGILGNLFDRLGLPRLEWNYGPRVGTPVYAVRDWIHFKLDNVIDWPVFNVADSMLLVGVSILLWQTVRAGRYVPNQASPT